MNSRTRFLNSIKLKKVDRPPIWLMRQAGRYLPEYRALKREYDFKTLVKTPELACEITLQPLKRFNLDAAIIFSDILVIPEALGQSYYFMNQGGIKMRFNVESKKQIESLDIENIPEKLKYVCDTISLTKNKIGNNKALLGFCGSPWTLACYMIQGGSSKDFYKVVKFIKKEPKAFDQLMEKLTQSLIIYINKQIEAGIDALQIFDSWASVAPQDYYENYSLKWISRIIKSVEKSFPIILYSKGMNECLIKQLQTNAKVLSLDWTISLNKAYKIIGNKCAIQGNLDPNILTTSPETVEKNTLKILNDAKKFNGFIFNLGHGMLPQQN